MSKEAVGQFNTKIGSSDYWSRLNRSTLLGGLMDSKTNYKATLRTLGEKAAKAIDEIYADLSKLGTLIRYLPSSDRNALAKQVEELYDVCRMGGVSAWHSSECVQGLNLSIMSPWTRSFRDDRSIAKAIDIIKSSPYSGSEALSLLRSASAWSISSAAGWDSKKKVFLEAVAQGKDSSFLQDVMEEYQNQTSPNYAGSCGHAVGSRSYLAYVESKVFGTTVSSFGTPDYERLLKDALKSIANQLERDMDSAIRENDYITDDTTSKLKAVVSELDHCGVSTGFLNSKIDKLAWFVGGDPAKIRNLQGKLNDLGVGQSLKVDGVYGEKTKTAIDKMIAEMSEFLSNPDKIRALDSTIDVLYSALDFLSGSQSPIWEVHNAVKKSRHELQRTIWKLGAEYYLRPRRYDVAALLLEHSLKQSPSNLHFSQSHWVTQRIMESKGFKKAFAKLEKNIQENPDVYAVPDKFDINFQETGDTDLYYGIGKCEVKYSCKRYSTSVRLIFILEDKYNFDYIRSISGDVETIVKFNPGLGNLANDAGLLSQADGVISVYHIFVTFEKTVELGGTFL